MSLKVVVLVTIVGDGSSVTILSLGSIQKLRNRVRGGGHPKDHKRITKDHGGVLTKATMRGHSAPKVY